MPKMSAGILLFRRKNAEREVFLVHPGGPFWKNKDAGAWSIPKGEYAEGDDPLEAAKREFREETGFDLAPAAMHPLGEVKLASGKVVKAWATEGDCDAQAIVSNTFSVEWPPKSGRLQVFSEVDRAEWFFFDDASDKINPAQRDFLDRLTGI